MGLTREEIRIRLIDVVRSFHEDTGESVAITDETGIFRELGLETIDAIGLSSALEVRFNQSFPFPEFMTVLSQKRATDITVGQLLDFLAAHLRQ